MPEFKKQGRGFKMKGMGFGKGTKSSAFKETRRERKYVKKHGGIPDMEWSGPRPVKSGRGFDFSWPKLKSPHVGTEPRTKYHSSGSIAFGSKKYNT